LQKQYFSCNGCWHDVQRGCDISAITALKCLVPQALLNGLFGRADWKRIYKLLE